jgi:hypothetical protein
MVSLRLVLVITVMLTLFSAAGRLNAQAGDGRRPMRISVEVSGNPEGEELGLTDFYRENLLLELRLAGLNYSEEKSPDVRITGEYELRDSELRFSLRATAAEDGRLLFSDDSTEPLGPDLDAPLLKIAQKLTEILRAYRVERNELFTSEPAPEEAREAGDSAGGMTFAADAGFFLAGGEAGRYLKSGYGPSLFGGYLLRKNLSLGFTAGLISFRAEGYAAGADGLILSGGPDLRFYTTAEGFFRSGFRVGIGGALFMVTPDDGNMMSKFSPWAETGLMAGFELGRVELQLFLDVAMFHESGTILYGILPRIGIHLP